jgi:hypothetical protein
MQTHRSFRGFSLALLISLLCAGVPRAQADPVTVRYVQGSLHGFLELRSPDGRVVAVGDATGVVRGGHVVTETVFHFKDGSVDDETAVYTQHRVFQLISDHHIQKGPSFPHPMDMTVDVPSGTVTVRELGKDGKVDVRTEHMKLPADLANGIVSVLMENLKAGEADPSFSMVVLTPKPRVVKLVVSNRGEDEVTVEGVARKATHYDLKIDLGGLAGVVAPLIGKAPPDIQMWVIGGTATTFAREIGPLYAEGPMMTIQLASPSWPQ